MTQVDAPLEVHAVGRHVLQADRVVETRARPTDRGDHEVTWAQKGHLRSHRFHLTEPFMADDEKGVALGRSTVFGRIDLPIGPIDADPQYLHQDAAPGRNV